MTFRNPIRIGDLVILNAEVSFAGHTSMETEVEVIAENPITGERTTTNKAYLVYVALGDDNKPQPVPQLLAETEVQKLRMAQAKERQAYRIAKK